MIVFRGVAPVYKPGNLATGQYPQADYGYVSPDKTYIPGNSLLPVLLPPLHSAADLAPAFLASCSNRASLLELPLVAETGYWSGFAGNCGSWLAG